jgi:hypothetical protein
MSFVNLLSQWHFHMLLALALIGILKIAIGEILAANVSLGTREACALREPKPLSTSVN